MSSPKTPPEQPQTYLITPPGFERAAFGDRLARVLDAHQIACLRLQMAEPDESALSRAADHLRNICHERDVAIVIDRHFRLVEKLGLDGCHLPDGARQVRQVRKELGEDSIIGAYCTASRHEGLTAGEVGADYIAFGPVAPSALGDGSVADHDLFQWWSEMIELPVVAEGGLTPALVASLAPVTDFFAIGPEIWGHDDAGAALGALLAAVAD